MGTKSSLTSERNESCPETNSLAPQIWHLVYKYRNNVPVHLMMALDKLLKSLEVELNSEHTVKRKDILAFKILSLLLKYYRPQFPICGKGKLVCQIYIAGKYKDKLYTADFDYLLWLKKKKVLNSASASLPTPYSKFPDHPQIQDILRENKLMGMMVTKVYNIKKDSEYDAYMWM